MSSNGAIGKTGFVWKEVYMWHTPQYQLTGQEISGVNEEKKLYLQPSQFFENAETKRRLYNLLSVCGLLDELHEIKAIKATEEDIARFHTRDYIHKVKQLSDDQGGEAGHHAFVGVGSYDIACWSVGGCMAAVKAVWNKEVRNAYALVRPPGHHAEREQGKGFCLFANVALAAFYARQVLNVPKVAILDWDVHHGNGTQQAFYEDDSVLFISIHQDNLYPHFSGDMKDNGKGKGEGYNLNIPLPGGTGIGGYHAAFDRVIIPALEKYKPDMIIVSCGFDPGALDPLGRMMLSSNAFRTMTKKVMQVADKVCEGRLVMCHEGGYSAEQVPFCGLAVVEALSGIETGVKDPFLGVEQHGLQDLQENQEKVIKAAEELLQKIK